MRIIWSQRSGEFLPNIVTNADDIAPLTYWYDVALCAVKAIVIFRDDIQEIDVWQSSSINLHEKSKDENVKDYANISLDE